MEGNRYDSIVIGAGIIGCSTAYYLAKCGKKVLLLDQFFLPHSRGGSHGHSRAIRKTYTQTDYSDMMPEAYDRWQQLERESKMTLISWCGELVIGSDNESMSLIEDNLEKRGGKWHKLKSSDLQERYQTFKVEKNTIGILDEEAGVIIADKCLAAFKGMIQSFGGHIEDGQKVIKIVPGQTVTVHTNSNVYTSSSLVIATGAWTRNLLKPLGIEIPLKIERIAVCYWKSKTPQLHHCTRFPVFSEMDGNNLNYCCIYGLPIREYNDLMKICIHGGSAIDPDYPDMGFDSKPSIEQLSDYIRRRLPGIEDKPSVMETCLYTKTPDNNFIIDTHPKWKNIAIGVGFSGHGFKMAPTVGRILGQLALEEIPPYDLSLFKIKRFFEKSKI